MSIDVLWSQVDGENPCGGDVMPDGVGVLRLRGDRSLNDPHYAQDDTE